MASSSLPPEHRLTGTGDHPPTGRLVTAEDAQPAGCPGLVNIGLSCYLNAALQSLAPCQEFVTWLGQYSRLSGGITTATINVLYELRYPTNDQVDPSAFYGRTFPISYQQQVRNITSPLLLLSVPSNTPAVRDCHEMFQHIMENIEEEICVCDDAGEVNPFLGKQKVRMHCESCRHEYPTTISSFYSITLNINPGEECALVDLLKRFTKRETIRDVDCTKCALKQPRTMTSAAMRHQASSSQPMTQTNPAEEQHANAKSTTGDSVYLKEISWEKLPKCLCIHINKTSTTGRVRFENTLTLRSQTQAVFYRLVAVVTHLWGINSGHYITYRLVPHGPQWYRTSDASVKMVSLDQVLTTIPYMLLYERRQPETSC